MTHVMQPTKQKLQTHDSETARWQKLKKHENTYLKKQTTDSPQGMHKQQVEQTKFQKHRTQEKTSFRTGDYKVWKKEQLTSRKFHKHGIKSKLHPNRHVRETMYQKLTNRKKKRFVKITD